MILENLLSVIHIDVIIHIYNNENGREDWYYRENVPNELKNNTVESCVLRIEENKTWYDINLRREIN